MIRVRRSVNTLLMSGSERREKTHTRQPPFYPRRMCLPESYLRKSPVSGGSGGISFFRSKVLSEDDNVRLTAVYKVRPFIPFLAPKEMRMENHFFSFFFLGFDLSKYAETEEQQKDEEMVFVTPAGTV